MTRRLLIVGYILLNGCFVAALIGHAAFMFGRVEHTGVMLYAWLAAIAMEGSLVYVTIAQLLARLAGEVPATALRYTQVGLIVISAYINFRQAEGSGNLLDQLVLSVTLPLFLAVNGDVGWLVLRPGNLAAQPTQPIAQPNPTIILEQHITSQAGAQLGASYAAIAQVMSESAEEVASQRGQAHSQPSATFLSTARKLPSDTTVAALSRLGEATVAEVAGATGKSPTWERQQLQLAVAAGVAEVVAGSSPARYKIKGCRLAAQNQNNEGVQLYCLNTQCREYLKPRSGNFCAACGKQPGKAHFWRWWLRREAQAVKPGAPSLRRHLVVMQDGTQYTGTIRSHPGWKLPMRGEDGNVVLDAEGQPAGYIIRHPKVIVQLAYGNGRGSVVYLDPYKVKAYGVPTKTMSLEDDEQRDPEASHLNADDTPRDIYGQPVPMPVEV